MKFQDGEDYSVCTVSARSQEDADRAKDLVLLKLAQFDAEESYGTSIVLLCQRFLLFSVFLGHTFDS